MTRSLYAMHEHCPLDVMEDGWILYIAEVGDGNDPHPGIDLSNEPRARMIRIQWLFGEHGGCYPPPDRIDGFIQRVESLVANTPDCHMWVGGNEPNHSVEGLFEPEYTAAMYLSIRTAVQEQTGHESDIVLLPPIGPWNAEIGFGWIEYFARVIDLCADIDGFALHTYAREQTPEAVVSEAKMNAPYNHLYSGFRTYRDWIAAIPEKYKDRPIYVTETNANQEWKNENTGFVQAAYKEIDNWNQAHTEQPIRCLMLYRWPHYDKYGIEGLNGVIDDFKAAQAHGYEVPEKGEPPMAEWKDVYVNRCEQGFYDQVDPATGQPAPELTVPVGFVAHWLHYGDGYFPRPELDKKEVPQPEVYEGQLSCGGFYLSSQGRFGFVSNRIYITPGEPLRASAMYMHVFNGAHIGGGSRVGIVQGDGPFDTTQTAWPTNGVDPFEDASIFWGAWRGTYQGDTPNREWVKLETSELQHGLDFVRLVVQFNADVAAEGSHGHWDVFRLEAYTEGDPGQPPVGGECDLLQLYALKAKEAEILSSAYNAIAEMWRNASDS